jgi:hypothetical protein
MAGSSGESCEVIPFFFFFLDTFSFSIAEVQ